MGYLTEFLTKEFNTYEDAIKFVNTEKKGEPCNTEGESPCKQCLKGTCSSLDVYNPYELVSINAIHGNKYLLIYTIND